MAARSQTDILDQKRMKPSTDNGGLKKCGSPDDHVNYSTDGTANSGCFFHMYRKFLSSLSPSYF